MKEPEHSFSIYVCSNHGTDVFPQNTSFKFSNPLPEALKLDKFDVALSKISFQDRFLKSSEEKIILPVPKSGGSIFDNTIFGDVVQYFEHKQETINITKTYESFINFIAGVNATLLRLGIVANFVPKYEGEKPVEMTLNFEESNGYTLTLSGSLPKILGFQTSTFHQGTHPNTLPPDYEFFKGISTGKSFPISVQKYEVLDIRVEHFDTPSLSDIMMDIQLKLTEAGKQVTIIVDEEKSTLRVDTKNVWTYLVLSNFLNKYLKLPPNYLFKGDVTVNVPREVLNPINPLNLETYIRPPTPPADISLDKVLVLASCASPSVFKEKYLPIIAVLDRAQDNDTFKFTANPAVYFPVGIKEVSSIEIQLLTDQLVHLDPFKTPTVVELHFKRTRL